MSTQKNEHNPEPELKPCPFCGSAATRGGNRCVCTNGNCQASIIPMLISHWNRRITPPTDTTGSGREGETPETDAAKKYSVQLYPHQNGAIETVSADFARQLERQRNAALAQVEALRRDGERLDWLEANPQALDIRFTWVNIHHGRRWDLTNAKAPTQDTLRAAIDSAQRQEGR